MWDSHHLPLAVNILGKLYFSYSLIFNLNVCVSLRLISPVDSGCKSKSSSTGAEVVEKVLDEHVPDSNDAASFDATRQFTPDEMAELQRRVAESNKQVEDFSSPEVDETNEVVSTPVDFGIPDTFESEVADFPTSAPVDEDFDLQPESTGEINLNETQTFKLNISE